jgi:hypothetical protein
MGEPVFKFDAQTLKAIDALKKQLGAKDEGEVLQKALVLAQLAAKQADDKGVVTIGGGKDQVRVNLSK